MAKVTILMVVSEDPKAWHDTMLTIRKDENMDIRATLENNYDSFRGWHLDAVIYVGNVSALHRQQFDTLVRKAPVDTGKTSEMTVDKAARSKPAEMLPTNFFYKDK